MKYLILLLFLLGNLSSFTQVPGLGQGKTYAVVVGISDYQDENIPDLRFADKDAEAFAGFLRSPAGGSLDEDHLKLLTNKQATLGKIDAALWWLVDECKPGDKAIIYFSGHGDVERRSMSQPGFLLCWDAPANAYTGGGTYSLFFLKDIVSTLAIQNKVKVTVITDACRSGKLAGSVIGGAQATAANLATQYANEIKILSCQPDEYSIEGEQWGGGRGAFSYHLLNGLYGMADGNEDLSVNLMEIGRYLEDRVSIEVAPQSQIPMTIGSRAERLTTVFPEILEQLKEGEKGQLQLFTPTESRGMEDEVLAQADSNIVEMYLAFQNAIGNKQFLEPATASADFYYEKLIKEPQLEKLHSSMRRNYAAALQDDAQQVMNRWLIGNIEELSLSKVNQATKYQNYPIYLVRAADLLGKAHYMYPVLKARSLFFEAYLLHIDFRFTDKQLGKKILSIYQEALQWQPDAAHVYNAMAWVYYCQMQQPDSAAHCATRAVELAPSWFLPYSNLGFLFSSEIRPDADKSKYFLELVDEVDSLAAQTNLWHILNWGLYYYRSKQYESAIEQYNKALYMDSTNSWTYNNIGLVYLDLQEFDKAEHQYRKSIQMDSTNRVPYYNLGNLYKDKGQNEKAKKHYLKAIQLDSSYSHAYVGLGNVYYNLGEQAKAIEQYKKAIKSDPGSALPYIQLGIYYWNTNQVNKAEEFYKKALQREPANHYALDNIGNVYAKKGQFMLAEKHHKKALQVDSTFTHAYNNLGNLYLNLARYEEAEQLFKRSIHYDSSFWVPYSNLGITYHCLQRWEEAAAMTQKAIDLFPNDGGLYGELAYALSYISGRTDEATAAFEKAKKLSPKWPDTYLYWAQFLLRSHLSNEESAPPKAMVYHYLQKAFENGLGKNGLLNVENIKTKNDFKAIRAEPIWTKLMQKYYPDEFKD